jgi:hypothetical protein
VDEGYITPQQSAKEGYDPSVIKAERATALQAATAQYEQNQAQQEQAADGWWEYSTNDSKCEVAVSTPKDAYDTLKATGSGPWVQRLSHDHVQLDWPDATNPQLYNYIDFFRNEAACLTFASALDNANNDLK